MSTRDLLFGLLRILQCKRGRTRGRTIRTEQEEDEEDEEVMVLMAN